MDGIGARMQFITYRRIFYGLAALLLWGCASANKVLMDTLTGFGFETKETPQGVVVVIPDVYFDFDEDKLTPVARENIELIANLLRQEPSADRPIAVNGHTDSVGARSYNLQLSERRANTVKRELILYGVHPGRVSINAFGETQPAAPNSHADGSDNPEGRAKNRRVEIVIQNSG